MTESSILRPCIANLKKLDEIVPIFELFLWLSFDLFNYQNNDQTACERLGLPFRLNAKTMCVDLVFIKIDSKSEGDEIFTSFEENQTPNIFIWLSFIQLNL